MRHALLGCFPVAAVSLVLVPAAPAYDPWMWLLWGRELAAGGLDTAEGPAFKPLPVAVTALLAPLGDAAPTAWLLIARVAALAAVVLAGMLAHRLARDAAPDVAVGGGAPVVAAGGRAPLVAARGHAPAVAAGGRAPLVAAGGRAPAAAAALAALGVAFTGPILALSAAGAAEGLFVAGALAAVLAWRGGRTGLALAFGAACALIRIEAVPFLVLATLVVGRDRPAWRPALLAGATLLPALWLLPDLVATGELLRSAGRARVPNPGQPALADLPALESLRRAAGLALAPVALGVVALRPHRDPVALILAVAALAWLGLVAAMAQLGFSGEERYALPGVAVLTVAGAVGLGRLAARRAWVPAAVLGVAVLAATPRLAGLPEHRARLAHGAHMAADLERAVVLAGGRAAVLACGRPVVGPYRGPLLAYRLAVAKRRVAFDPGAAGVIFVSRLWHERVAAPAASAGHVAVARAGTWRVLAQCGAQTGE